MRTITEEKTLYKFEELPEKIQEKVLLNWRNGDSFPWSDEHTDTLKEFTDLFNIKINNWQVDIYGPSYINFSSNFEDEIYNMNYLRLHKYIVNNYYNNIYTKKTYYAIKNQDGTLYKNCIGTNTIKYTSKIKREKFNCPLTGVYCDNEILSPIYDFIEKPWDTDINSLIKDCLNSWVKCFEDELKYWESEECIKEEIQANEYEFLENGTIY